MRILGIDSSCDDLAMGIIDEHRNIIRQTKMSLMCEKYGGVIPEMAARNHLDYIDIMFKEIVGEESLDLIGVTIGPGLIPGLVVGAQFAKAYAQLNNINFVPVHHLEGHIQSAGIVQYPFLALLISGGHSDLYACKSFGEYELLMKSLDDSAGEVFDKVGRKFGLPFPSGPHVEKAAKNATIHHSPMIPMKGQMQFSFSGLKTRAIRLEDTVENVSWFLQESVALTLKEKLQMAIDKTGIERLVVCGGVAANCRIRECLDSLKLQDNSVELIFPPLALCMDNGPMIAFAAYEHYKNGSNFVNRFDLEEFSRKDLTHWKC